MYETNGDGFNDNRAAKTERKVYNWEECFLQWQNGVLEETGFTCF